MVHHTFSRRSSTQPTFSARPDAFWKKQGKPIEVLARISKISSGTHVRRFAESANKIIPFADSTNQKMSQLQCVSNRNYFDQFRTGRSGPREQGLKWFPLYLLVSLRGERKYDHVFLSYTNPCLNVYGDENPWNVRWIHNLNYGTYTDVHIQHGV